MRTQEVGAEDDGDVAFLAVVNHLDIRVENGFATDLYRFRMHGPSRNLPGADPRGVAQLADFRLGLDESELSRRGCRDGARRCPGVDDRGHQVAVDLDAEH